MTTGHISPQFHVLYDDWFTTMGTDAQGDPEPIDDKKWTEQYGEERFQVAFNGNEPVELENEWLRTGKGGEASKDRSYSPVPHARSSLCCCSSFL
jgi:hypothetical protein